MGAGIVVVAALIVVAVIALTGDDEEPGRDDQAGGEEGNGDQVDEVAVPTLTPAEPIPVGRFPDGLAVDGEDLWVTSTFGGQAGDLTRIDLVTGQVEDSFVVGGEPIGVTVAEGSVWVTRRSAGQVARIDPASGAETATIATPGEPHELAFGAGALWVNAGVGTLYRIDPADNSVQVASDQLTPDLSGLAITDDRVWVSYGADPGTVAAMDPRSFEVLDEVPIAGDVDDIAIGDSGLWVAQRSGDAVSRVDPETLEVTEVQVGAGPAGIAIDGDRVWVINNDADSLTLIDGPRAEVLTNLTVGDRPLAVVTSPGRVWASLSGADQVAVIDVS